MIISSKVKFIDDELENTFNNLSNDDPIKKALIKAFQNIGEDYQAANIFQKIRFQNLI